MNGVRRWYFRLIFSPITMPQKEDQKRASYYQAQRIKYLHELNKMIIASPSAFGQGMWCLPYASHQNAATGHGWRTPDGNKTGSVAATAYTLFALFKRKSAYFAPQAMKQKKLQQIFKLLYRHYGPQQWWPARSRLEIIVGAVLTQNTGVVECGKSHSSFCARINSFRLKNLPLLLSGSWHKSLGRPGYFNIKAKRLKNVVLFIQSRYGGSLRRMMCR